MNNQTKTPVYAYLLDQTRTNLTSLQNLPTPVLNIFTLCPSNYDSDYCDYNMMQCKRLRLSGGSQKTFSEQTHCCALPVRLIGNAWL